MRGTYKGLTIGALNMLVIAIGLGTMNHSADAALTVAFIGILPGLIAGGILGNLASRMHASPVALRVAVLFLPAFLVLIMLATKFAMPDLAFVSLIPTLVAVLVLERWTRYPTQLPSAQVR